MKNHAYHASNHATNHATRRMVEPYHAYHASTPRVRVRVTHDDSATLHTYISRACISWRGRRGMSNYKELDDFCRGFCRGFSDSWRGKQQ